VQLGVVLGFAARLDLLRFMPVEIPIDLSGLHPGDVTALLAMFLGDSLGFDYGTLFLNPIGLRSILPQLLKDPEPMGPEDFWMEWECPEETAENGAPTGPAGLICSQQAVLVDGAHFQGTEYEIEADGFDSPLPYAVWEDPTWGGFLQVDQNYLEESGENAAFVEPDLHLTNLGVHLWLKTILGLLRQ